MKNSVFAQTYYLLAICILLGSQAVMAQEQQTANETQFGLKGGVNFSDLFTEGADRSNTIAGFNAGLFAKVAVASKWAIQPEIYYTTKGAEVTYNNSFVDGTARFRLNYIEMPLLLVADIGDKVQIMLGPYASYLVGGKVKNSSNVQLFNFEDNISVNDYNRFDFGIVAGISMDFGTVSIGSRYTYGLTTVGKERTFAGSQYTFPDANNGVLNFFMAVPILGN
ncbi:MAG: porin family protein [Bacteroidota bacterium]